MMWFVIGGIAVVGLFWFLMPDAVKSVWATVKGWFTSKGESE